MCVICMGEKTRFWKKNSHSVRPYFKTKSLTFRRLLNCTFFRKLCLLCFQCAVHNIYNIHIASTCTQYLLRIKCFDTGAKILSWIHCCKHTIHISTRLRQKIWSCFKLNHQWQILIWLYWWLSLVSVFCYLKREEKVALLYSVLS